MDVRVRVDSGAYGGAIPVAPGNWSTWSQLFQSPQKAHTP